MLSRKTFWLLLLANVVVSLMAVSLASRSEFPDAIGYKNMANSLGVGQFSSWYFLNEDTPETLRIWGYPFFLYLCRLVSVNDSFVRCVQLLLYFLSISLMLTWIGRHRSSTCARSLFLALLLPNIQLPYYSGLLAPESVAGSCLVAFMFVWIEWIDGRQKSVVMALLASVVFQLKPTFLFFPFLLTFLEITRKKKGIRIHLVFLGIYSLLLLPFGFWNYKHHGVFKVTPLDGGGAVAHYGYWMFRLPSGYVCPLYWKNTISRDIFQPEIYPQRSLTRAPEDYELEMQRLTQRLAPLLSKNDLVKLEKMRANDPGQFLTYNSAYTLERERLLWQFTKNHILEDPYSYLRGRIYTAVRMWFTGIRKDDFSKLSARQKLVAIYPFAVSFVSIFGGLIASVFFFRFRRIEWNPFSKILGLVIYFNIIQLPFVIQARYLVPLHSSILFLLALGLTKSYSPAAAQRTAEIK